MKDYHDLYLKVVVLLLACGFEIFRKESMNSFELDSTYLSTPDYIWDALLRSSGFNLRLISVIGKHQLIESTVSGCIYLTYKEYGKASNKFSKSYYAKTDTLYIIYSHVNNLYEHSMMKLLSTQIPDGANPKDFSLNNYSKNGSLGCFL